MKWIPLAAGLGLALVPCLAFADRVVLTASKDNTIFEDAEGGASDGASVALFSGCNGALQIRRALIAFEIAGVIPKRAVVDSVILTLHVSRAPDAIPRRFELHRVTDGWGEGTSDGDGGGGGAPAADGDATWLHRFHPGSPWSTAGGDFDAEVSAATTIEGMGSYRWSGTRLTADVKRWLSDPTRAHGWLLRGDERTGRSVRRFDSRASADPSRRPSLTIHFSRRPMGGSTSWGNIKSRYR